MHEAAVAGRDGVREVEHAKQAECDARADEADALARRRALERAMRRLRQRARKAHAAKEMVKVRPSHRSIVERSAKCGERRRCLGCVGLGSKKPALFLAC